jgi:hypothetical protein
MIAIRMLNLEIFKAPEGITAIALSDRLDFNEKDMG